jgi:hypothetical protein
MSAVSNLKLRASYGIAGNNQIPNYGPISLLNKSNYVSGTTVANGLTIANLSNDNLSWEKTAQTNLGLDLTLLNGRFNFVADAYVKTTRGGIFTLAVPVTTGYSTITTNANGIRNKGLELQVIANVFKPTSKFQWQILVNWAHNDNVITSLPNGGRDIYLDKFILRQGQPLNSYNVFKATGIYKTDADVPVNPVSGRPLNFYGFDFKGGDPIWQDSNGDGVLDNTDYVPAGNPNPKMTGGFSNTFSYRRFTLDIFCTYTVGRQIYNDYLAGKLSQLIPTDDGNPDPYHSISTHSFPDLSGINYWRNPGDNAQYPALTSVYGTRYKYALVSSQWVESGTYLRIKKISLGYSLAPALLEKLHMRRVRVYGLIDNLKIFQKSKNVPDAEEVDAFGIYSGSGYPIPKKFTFGLDISL